MGTNRIRLRIQNNGTRPTKQKRLRPRSKKKPNQPRKNIPKNLHPTQPSSLGPSAPKQRTTHRPPSLPKLRLHSQQHNPTLERIRRSQRTHRNPTLQKQNSTKPTPKPNNDNPKRHDLAQHTRSLRTQQTIIHSRQNRKIQLRPIQTNSRLNRNMDTQQPQTPKIHILHEHIPRKASHNRSHKKRNPVTHTCKIPSATVSNELCLVDPPLLSRGTPTKAVSWD